MLKLNPYKIGNIAEANIAARLITIGRQVLKPMGEGFRYDLLVDNLDGTYTRGQCKNGRLRNGSILFNTISTGGFCRAASRGYHGQADVFWVWCAALQKAYEIPVPDAPSTMMILRVSPPKNNHSKRVNLAANFEL